MLSAVKEGLHVQLKIVFDKLTEAENNLHVSPRKIEDQTTSLTKAQALPNPPSSNTGTTNDKKLLREVREEIQQFI